MLSCGGPRRGGGGANYSLQGLGNDVIGHVREMVLDLDRLQGLVVSQGLQVALVLFEESLQLLTVEDLSFYLADASVVNSDPRRSTPAILGAIPKGLHFLHFELVVSENSGLS